MAEKGFKQASTENNSIMETISAGHTQGTQDTQPTKGRAGRPQTKTDAEYYRFNLNMPIEYRDYLKQAVYDASTPDKIVTITEYICNLIKADMEANHGKK